MLSLLPPPDYYQIRITVLNSKKLINCIWIPSKMNKHSIYKMCVAGFRDWYQREAQSMYDIVSGGMTNEVWVGV